MCQYLLTQSVERGSQSQDISREAQKFAAALLQQGAVTYYEILSLEVLGNAIRSLLHSGAIHIHKTG